MAKVRGLGVIFNSNSEIYQARRAGLSETPEQLLESGISTFLDRSRGL
jgi:hypothetical protein